MDIKVRGPFFTGKTFFPRADLNHLPRSFDPDQLKKDIDTFFGQINAQVPDRIIMATWITKKMLGKMMRKLKKNSRKARLIRENRCKR